MPVIAWEVDHAFTRWGADGQGTIIPASLASDIAAHEGETMVTQWGKEYVVHASDPQSVWDYFDTEIDPIGDREALLWEYVDDEEP